MNWRNVAAIARKDLGEVRQNRMVWLPMILLPLILCTILPIVLIVLPQIAGSGIAESMNDPDLARMLENLPAAMKAQIEGMNANQQMIYIVLGFMFAPLFLILPIMTASVVGTNSFVGEKERKTIEALLYTPATDHELFFGKMLAAISLSLAITLLSFVLYALVLNGLGASIMGGIWFPTPVWWVLIIWLAPAVSVLGMLGAVVVSARARTFMEAYQMTGLLVLPVLLLLIGQVAGVISLSIEVTLFVGCAVWLLDVALLWGSLHLFSRYSLFESARL
ncbi:MAG: ABC transporter permease subunit [Anaerolineae bacterium]|nr:ABC transporter permease subunit [Anaerolineae bacterium]